jgi:hypothetical protein
MHLPFLLATGITAVCVLASVVQAGGDAQSPYWVYVAGKDAISLFRLNPATAKLEPQGTAAPTGAGFLAFSPDERFLYATADTLDATHKRTGAVAAFSVDRATGGLTLLNRQPSAGDGPCFVTVDPLGKARQRLPSCRSPPMEALARPNALFSKPVQASIRRGRNMRSLIQSISIHQDTSRSSPIWEPTSFSSIDSMPRPASSRPAIRRPCSFRPARDLAISHSIPRVGLRIS